MPLTQTRHFLAHRPSNFPADIGIDFIKHHQRRAILISQRIFHRQHHSRNLPARSDLPERLERLSRIWTEEIFDIFKTMRARFLPGFQLHFKLSLLKPQINEMGTEPLEIPQLHLFT